MSFAYSFILMGLTETEYIFWPYSFILMGLTETEYIFWPSVLF